MRYTLVRWKGMRGVLLSGEDPVDESLENASAEDHEDVSLRCAAPH